MQISQILRVSEQGVSRPYQCYDEDGVLRWCKGNHTGLRSLLSEWICARIAHKLGLPVPPCDILRLDVRMFENWRKSRGIEVPQLVTETNQFVFASVHVENAKDVVDVNADLRSDDPELLVRIYLFDELVRNTDRTDYNSNLLSNTGVHVIDHNNAFDPAFDPVVFANEHALRRFRAACSPETLDTIRIQMRDVVTEAFLDEIWSEMPQAWTGPGSEILPLDLVKDILLRGGL